MTTGSRKHLFIWFTSIQARRKRGINSGFLWEDIFADLPAMNRA
jgi:hypothetical protein